MVYCPVATVRVPSAETEPMPVIDANIAFVDVHVSTIVFGVVPGTYVIEHVGSAIGVDVVVCAYAETVRRKYVLKTKTVA